MASWQLVLGCVHGKWNQVDARNVKHLGVPVLRRDFDTLCLQEPDDDQVIVRLCVTTSQVGMARSRGTLAAGAHGRGQTSMRSMRAPPPS